MRIYSSRTPAAGVRSTGRVVLTLSSSCPCPQSLKFISSRPEDELGRAPSQDDSSRFTDPWSLYQPGEWSKNEKPTCKWNWKKLTTTKTCKNSDSPSKIFTQANILTLLKKIKIFEQFIQFQRWWVFRILKSSKTLILINSIKSNKQWHHHRFQTKGRPLWNPNVWKMFKNWFDNNWKNSSGTLIRVWNFPL